MEAKTVDWKLESDQIPLHLNPDGIVMAFGKSCLKTSNPLQHPVKVSTVRTNGEEERQLSLSGDSYSCSSFSLTLLSTLTLYFSTY